MSKLNHRKPVIKTKYIFQFVFTTITLLFFVSFIKNNLTQLQQSFNLLFKSQPVFVVIAVFFSFMFLFVLANIYKSAFKALNSSLPLKDNILLALKRNFVGVFIPAGGIVSYAMFTSDIENKGVSKSRIYLASLIFAISCAASLLIITIPALVLLVFHNDLSNHFIIGFSIIAFAVAALFLLFHSVFKRGIIYKLFSNMFPQSAFFFDDLCNEQYSMKRILIAVMFSLVGETCGIIQLFLVTKALGVDISLSTVLICYAIASFTYALSPFMRGVGAVEITLALSLSSFNVPEISAVSVSLFFRLFNFWLPLTLSGLSFLFNGKKLIQSIIPLFINIAYVFSNHRTEKRIGERG